MCLCLFVCVHVVGIIEGMSGYVHSHNTAAAAASPEYDGMLV